MTRNGALQDLRVIDLTNDTGRFATKLLTEAGADVVRLSQGSPGLPMNGEAGKHGVRERIRFFLRNEVKP